MLEEYQARTQEAVDLLNQAVEILQEITTTLHDNYPEEERTFRMGQAIQRISTAYNSAVSASSSLTSIEWPTEDRPR